MMSQISRSSRTLVVSISLSVVKTFLNSFTVNLLLIASARTESFGKSSSMLLLEVTTNQECISGTVPPLISPEQGHLSAQIFK